LNVTDVFMFIDTYTSVEKGQYLPRTGTQRW